MEYFEGGKVTKENMTEFMKEIKKAGNLTDEEAAQIAASKIADSKPKSRMYYKIGASRWRIWIKSLFPHSMWNVDSFHAPSTLLFPQGDGGWEEGGPQGQHERQTEGKLFLHSDKWNSEFSRK